MQETDFQALFEEYEQASTEDAKEQALQPLHTQVYYFPMRRFAANADEAGDFYLSLYEKIPTIVEAYDVSFGVPFAAFFAGALRREYYKFKRGQNRREESVETAEDIDWDSDTGIFHTQLVEARNQSSWQRIRSILREALEILRPRDHVLVRLYYGFPLKIQQLRQLVQKHRSFRVFQIYREYLQKIHKWEQQEQKRRERVEWRLSRLYERIKNGDRSAERYREHWLRRITEMKSPVTLEFLSQLTAEARSTLHRRLGTARNQIKNWLQKRGYLKELFTSSKPMRSGGKRAEVI